MSHPSGNHVEDLASRIGRIVRLEAQDDDLRGSCPLHPDVSRSLYVHRRRQLFHCFSCGVSGGHDAWSTVLARMKPTAS
jgi:DNA primase